MDLTRRIEFTKKDGVAKDGVGDKQVGVGGDDEKDEDGVDEGVLEMMMAILQGCKVHRGDQEPVEGVHCKPLPISGAGGAKVLLIPPLHPILSFHPTCFLSFT